MPSVDVSLWSATDDLNTSLAPEGMTPASVNDAIRAVQGSIRRAWEKTNATQTSGGSANAYTLTYSVSPAAYVNGEIISFIASFANTSAATLNVNSLGARSIVRCDGSTLQSGDIQNGGVAFCMYSAAAGKLFLLNLIPPAPTVGSLGGLATTGGTMTGDITMSSGADVVLGTGSTILFTRAVSIVAAGTNQATATALTATYNEVGTATGTTGVQLPTPQIGMAPVWVFNRTANAVLIYPTSGGFIESLGVNVAYSLPSGKDQMFIPIASVLWYTANFPATYS